MQKTTNSARCLKASTFAGRRKKRVGWILAVAGSALLVVAGGAGLLSGHAQSSPPQIYISLPQPTSIPAIASEPQPAVALAKANPPAQEPANAIQARLDAEVAPAAQERKEPAGEAAELLKMATSLKAEVDKTTKDTLSVAVVRKAGEIEQLAHKVRLGVGKD
jgi:hypothetical protein